MLSCKTTEKLCMNRELKFLLCNTEDVYLYFPHRMYININVTIKSSSIKHCLGLPWRCGYRGLPPGLREVSTPPLPDLGPLPARPVEDGDTAQVIFTIKQQSPHQSLHINSEYWICTQGGGQQPRPEQPGPAPRLRGRGDGGQGDLASLHRHPAPGHTLTRRDHRVLNTFTTLSTFCHFIWVYYV